MRSIRGKLVLSYIVLMLLMLLPVIYEYHAFNQVSVRYGQLVDNLLLVESIPNYADQIVSVYQRIYPDIHNQQLRDEYQASKLQIETVLKNLDLFIVDAESRVLYQGIRNVINGILEDMDEGIRYGMDGDLLVSSGVYDTVVRKSTYLEQNTATLLLHELGLVKSFQKEMEEQRTLTSIYGTVLIVMMAAGGVMLAVISSKHIVGPVETLSRLSEKVSEGNYAVTVPDYLRSRKDETGTLARSYGEMLDILTSQIHKLKQIQHEVQKKNGVLEKLNNMMVNRELKMVELKKKLAALKE